MASVSVRALNANISAIIARVEAGETIDLTKNGKVVGEIRAKVARRADDPAWRSSFETLVQDLDAGVPFGRTFTHDERNG